MKVTILIEVRDQNLRLAGASVSGAEVGPDYSEEKLAERAKKQFRAAKANLNERIAAREAERARQAVLFDGAPRSA